MSLLIKALDKAEKAQAVASENQSTFSETSALSLEPAGVNDKPAAFNRPPQQQQQTRAANVFSAKSTDEPNNALWLALGGLGLLAGLGLYFYLQLNQLNQPQSTQPQYAQPQLTQPNGAIESAQAMSNVAPIQPSASPLNGSEMAKNEPVGNDNSAVTETIVENKVQTKVEEQAETKAETKTEMVAVAQAEKPVARKNAVVFKRTQKSGLAEPIVIASPSISVTKSANKREAQGQTLMRAYQAFQQGDEDVAQVLYQQVLNKEPYNLDALLGMGVIAQRQQKMDEAEIWFAKVLKLDPQNAIASAALQTEPPMTVANVEVGQADQVESQLKSQLINSPNDANLHTRLGHFYAEQNRWSDAQAAFFEAYRLNSQHADYAYNLAVSLDQLGKPNLAATYYQQALRLIEAGAHAAVSAETISTRLQTIQQ